LNRIGAKAPGCRYDRVIVSVLFVSTAISALSLPLNPYPIGALLLAMIYCTHAYAGRAIIWAGRVLCTTVLLLQWVIHLS
jgi:hypothetical protein